MTVTFVKILLGIVLGSITIYCIALACMYFLDLPRVFGLPSVLVEALVLTFSAIAVLGVIALVSSLCSWLGD